MRIILCCLGLLFAEPAFANPVEDGLCHTRTQAVEKMEKSEKLCRAFVRAMRKLPGETMKEVQAMVSPESLTLMGAMTKKVKRRPARQDSEAFQYQRKHAGPEEMQVSGGGQQV